MRFIHGEMDDCSLMMVAGKIRAPKMMHELALNES